MLLFVVVVEGNELRVGGVERSGVGGVIVVVGIGGDVEVVLEGEVEGENKVLRRAKNGAIVVSFVLLQ